MECDTNDAHLKHLNIRFLIKISHQWTRVTTLNSTSKNSAHASKRPRVNGSCSPPSYQTSTALAWSVCKREEFNKGAMSTRVVQKFPCLETSQVKLPLYFGGCANGLSEVDKNQRGILPDYSKREIAPITNGQFPKTAKHWYNLGSLKVTGLHWMPLKPQVMNGPSHVSGTFKTALPHFSNHQLPQSIPKFQRSFELSKKPPQLKLWYLQMWSSEPSKKCLFLDNTIPNSYFTIMQ